MSAYSGCPHKMTARRETIIDQYRKHIGHFLPKHKQYWSMCAIHVDANGRLLQGSELDQMLSAGLISTDQFHGVDLDPSIISANAEGIPDAHWHLGDMIQNITKAMRTGSFLPGIVNCDHILMPRSGGATYISRCLQLLSDQEDLILISNLILRSPHDDTSCSPEEYVEELWRHHQFRDAMRRGWQYDDAVYIYGGSGPRSSTVMGTIVFWKG